MASEILRAVNVLHAPGEVIELRAFKGGQIVSGYFNDHERLARVAEDLDRVGYNVYTTLNPVNPALLSRAHNRVRERPGATTSDDCILHRRRLLVDIDPKRPSGVSATDEEKKVVSSRGKEVREFTREQGWPDPVVCDSGNGFHLNYGIDLPNDSASADLIKQVLEALAFMFNDERVEVDTSVHNAARICRLYGTVNRKGDHTEERPHRWSKIVKIPEAEEVTA